ncbi:MAG TPA: response regulator transcription factor [Bacteroidia bacterium]|nr:response regulator transcription factor [Bacteroidia bacterium]HNT80314.1 response regulator transcription factor [Bacteroidia bacterium]
MLDVLIVDDSLEIGSRIKELVSECENINVVGQAINGKQAMEMAWEHKPEIIILDLKMPVITGFDLLPHFKNNALPITVIMLTNYNDAFFRKRAKDLGVDYFLDKSTEFEKVTEILKNFKSKRKPHPSA